MKISDESMIRSVALPAAAATALTDALGLKTSNNGVGPLGLLEVHLTVDAVPNLVEEATITVDLLHSDAEEGTYEVIPTTGNMVVVGGTGNGAEKTTWRFYLPPDTLSWVKAQATVETGGGNNTASNLTLEFRV